MLSKKNVQMMNRKGQPQKQRFGLRKLTIGVASILLGLTFLGASSASADEAINQEQQVTQTELTTPQPVEVVESESARQPNSNEVASSSSAEAIPVSSEATSQVVADSAAAVQTPVASAAQPEVSTAPEQVDQVGSGNITSDQAPSSEVGQEKEAVEIKFQDRDNYNLIIHTVHLNGKKPGDKVTLAEIVSLLPAGLE